MLRAVVLLIMAMLSAFYSGAAAEDSFTATITIRDHRFEPAELHVPAGKRILLTVINADPLSEEFDSTALKVEKVIALAIYLVKLRASARYKEKASTQSRTDLLAAPFCHSPIVEIL